LPLNKTKLTQKLKLRHSLLLMVIPLEDNLLPTSQQTLLLSMLLQAQWV
jgi:hypothetical protein